MAFVLTAAWASAASATPTKTSPCSNCHSGAAVAVTATQVSVSASTAVYKVSAPTATAIAIFSGSTKLAYAVATSAQFSVAPGKTYTIYAVKGPTTSDGIGQTSVSPVAPAADSTPPSTSSDATTTYVGSATITLSATDAGGSGVANTYYVLDGGLQTTGTRITVTSIGGHTLEYWSVDGAGNVELHKLAAFVVAAVPDTTAPVTTSNALTAYTGSATIALSATDAGGSGVAHTYYRLDTGAQTEGTQIAVSTAGTHTVEFWSVDGAGNAETPHKTATFTIIALPDTAAPVTTSDALASYVGTATITLVATDTGGSGVAHTYYRLDAGAQAEGMTISTSVVGTHAVEFWSVDTAGNAETPHKTATFSIAAPVGNDTTPPTTTSNAVASYATTATIILSGKDNRYGSGVSATYYRLDGGLRAAGTTVTVGAPGTHSLEFWSVDKAANEELPHKTATFLVDPLAPTTGCDARAFYNGPAVVTLNATDNAGGCGVATTFYRLDGAAQTSGTVVAASSAGPHTVEYWSRDALGNVESPHKSVQFTIDMQAPASSCDATAAYTKTATITLDATDMGGAGVARTYFSLDGTPAQQGTQVLAYLPGAHTLEFWSEDNAGNAENPHRTVAFTVDSLAPFTTANAKSSYIGPATISLTAADTGGAGVQCTYFRLDSGPQTIGTSVRVTAIGTHKLTFWSVDRFGNTEAPKAVSFAVKPVPFKVTVVRLPYPSVYTVWRRSGVARYTLKVRLTRPSGAALAGATVCLQARVSTTKPWTTMYVLKTNTYGVAYHTYAKKRAATVYYRWYVPATSAHYAAVTASQKVIIK